MHVQEKPITGEIRKYNMQKASEVVALVIGEQHIKLDIVLRLRR